MLFRLRDGSIKVDSENLRLRFPVKAPDGLDTNRQGNLYFTARNVVYFFNPFVRKLGQIKIPRGSGTNLCFGGEDRVGKTIFITSLEAMYAVETPAGGF